MKKDIVYIGEGGVYDGWVFLSCGLFNHLILYYKEKQLKFNAKTLSFLWLSQLRDTKLVKIGTL